MVLKELNFNSFYIRRVWKSSTFPLWEGVVVLKELIFNSFYIGMVWWSCKN